MDLSFIIPAHKSEQHLNKCISSIRKYAIGLSYEIIIVQNDGRKLFSMPQQDIIMINLHHNKGFGNACNIGAKQAKGDILFFLNPDTELLNNISSSIKQFFLDKKISIIAPALITTDGKIQKWSAGKEINIVSLIKNNLFDWNSKALLEKKSVLVDWVSGAAFLIKRDIFDKIGGFDENFFMYYEDIDLCLRIRNAGGKIILLSEIKVLHIGGQSYGEKSKRKKSDYIVSQDYYFKKHFGKSPALFLRLIRNIFLND